MAHPYKDSRVTKLDGDSRLTKGRKIPKALLADKENDEHKLKQRQKQIDFGKNTIGYQNFIKKYPTRNQRPPEAPSTPDKHQKCSKRSWDGQIRIWRKKLHIYDDTKEKTSEQNDEEDEYIVIDEEEEAERILQEHKNDKENENQQYTNTEPTRPARREAKSIYDDFEEDEFVEVT